MMKKSDTKMGVLYFAIILSINTAIAVVLFSLGYIQYATDDDFYMMAQAAGAYGEYSPYLINSMVSSVVLGWILRFLFLHFPICNWMTLFYLGATIIGETVIEFCIIRKNGFAKIGFSVFLSILLIPYLLLGINYTKMGGLLSLASVVVCGSITDETDKKRRIYKYFIMVFLFFSAYITRDQAALFVLPFLAVFIIGHLRRLEFRPTKSFYIQWLIIFILYASVIISLTMVNAKAYSATPDIARLDTREKNLTELRDYGTPLYEEHEAEYKELGILPIDIEMLTGCYYLDEEVFCESTLKSIIAMKTQGRVGIKKRLLEVYEVFSDEVIKYSLFVVSLILSVLFLFCGTRFFETVSAFILSMAEIVFLIFLGRYPLRVLYVPMLACIAVMVATADLNFLKMKKGIYGAMGVLVVYALLSCGINSERDRGYGYRKDDSKELIEMSKQSDNLYIVDSDVLFFPYSPMDIPTFNSWSNIAFDEGWVVDTITNENKIRSFLNGDDNVYKLATTCDNLYFVGGDSIDMKLEYIKNHYSPKAKYELVDVVGGEEVYRFYEAEE